MNTFWVSETCIWAEEMGKHSADATNTTHKDISGFLLPTHCTVQKRYGFLSPRKQRCFVAICANQRQKKRLSAGAKMPVREEEAITPKA